LAEQGDLHIVDQRQADCFVLVLGEETRGRRQPDPGGQGLADEAEQFELMVAVPAFEGINGQVLGEHV
jgi:hypothetical protein